MAVQNFKFLKTNRQILAILKTVRCHISTTVLNTDFDKIWYSDDTGPPKPN